MPSWLVPPSFLESRLSLQHFNATFNGSQVAPSGTDGSATHGSASRDAEKAALARTAGMLRLRGTLSAHWPGIRGLGLCAAKSQLASL